MSLTLGHCVRFHTDPLFSARVVPALLLAGQVTVLHLGSKTLGEVQTTEADRPVSHSSFLRFPSVPLEAGVSTSLSLHFVFFKLGIIMALLHGVL